MSKVRALAGAWYRVSWPRLSHNSSHGHQRSPETQPKSLNSNTSSGITNATMTTSTDPQLVHPISRKTTTSAILRAIPSKHKTCTQTTIKFVCWMLPLVKYQNGVAALVTDVITKSAPI